ncbi:MAG: CoA transferase [Cellvibrionaceae bacterium]|nr:CoA transferase [Cellvibrionaceae bacterium]
MSGPLSGLKILDFSTLLPGPYATQLLADMGAEVLRIESPTRPDLLRFAPPMVGEISAGHGSINRNKQCIALDLKQPESTAIVKKLLQEYDIVLEQFRPGVMQRLGLDYQTLSAEKPELIYCSITGYGQTGPLKDRAGHDINYLALAGLASYSGRKDSGPILSGTQIADIAGGTHHAVMGILAAVIERHSNGKGQHIDISMSDAALALSTTAGAGHLAGDKAPELSGTMLNGGIFYDYYETSDGRHISVGSLEPQFCKQLCEALGKADWFERAMNYSPDVQAELKQDLIAAFKQKSFAEWSEIFAALDACVEPVLDLGETEQHPHFQERGMYIEIPAADGQQLRQIASPIKFSGSQTEYRNAGLPIGANTEEVLQQLGYDSAAIAALREAGAIA